MTDAALWGGSEYQQRFVDVPLNGCLNARQVNGGDCCSAPPHPCRAVAPITIQFLLKATPRQKRALTAQGSIRFDS